MNGVRVYMRAGWTKSAGMGNVGSYSDESGDVTILEYEDAAFSVNHDYLLIYPADKSLQVAGEEIAVFPPGDWTGVERF